VPQGGRVFKNLTVRENLLMGGYILKDKNEKKGKIDEIYNLFPILKERRNQMAGTLSGDRFIASYCS
jgi:branched-chain amino acid transport system ATP-binding protein